MLLDQRVTYAGVGPRQLGLDVGIVRLQVGQHQEHVARLGTGDDGGLGLAEYEQCPAHFHQRFGLALAQRWRRFPRSQQLVLELARTIENILDDRRRHADGVAEFLREVSHQTCGGAGRERERAFGPFLRGERNAALPVRQASQNERKYEPSRQAAGENVAPPRGAATALPR